MSARASLGRDREPSNETNTCLLRVDLLALACSTGALFLVAKWPHSRRRLTAAGLCLTAAVFTRQSYALAAPLASFVWMWTYDRRSAIRLAVQVAGSCFILFLSLSLMTQGGFTYHVVVANVNEFATERLMWNLRRLLDAAPVMLVLGGLILVVAPGRLGSWSLLVPYLIGAALSSLMIGKIGSNVNYLNRRRDLLQLRELERMVAAADGPVLADEYMGMITLQRWPLYLQPFEVTQMARAGLWDQTPLVDNIGDGRFSLILIHYFRTFPVYKERWTGEMLAAINQAYVPGELLADTRVYRPARRLRLKEEKP